MAKNAKLAADIHAACIGRESDALIDPKLVAQVRAKPVARAELLRDFHGEILFQASFYIDHGKFL